MSKYLFIGSHCDDLELSCGGYISRQIELGFEVSILCLSEKYNGVSLRHEFLESMRLLKPDDFEIHDFKTRDFQLYRQQILDVMLRYKDYDYVITHSAKSFHQDHKVVGEESIRAFKKTNLITYTHEWDQRTIAKNYFVELDERHLENKIKALSCYKSQFESPFVRPYMTRLPVTSTAVVNGLMCGTKYAEAFEVINYLV